MKPNIHILQCNPTSHRKFYWDDDNKIQDFLDNGVNLDNIPHEYQILIKELDRRCAQLWDKVIYENKNKLVATKGTI